MVTSSPLLPLFVDFSFQEKFTFVQNVEVTMWFRWSAKQPPTAVHLSITHQGLTVKTITWI